MSFSGASAGASLITRLGIEGLPAYTTGMKGAGDEVERFAKRSNSSLEGVGKGMSKVGKSMSMFVTAPIIAGATASVLAAEKLDLGLRKVNSLTGLTGPAAEKSFGMFKSQVAQLSTQLGIAQTTLVDGLYQAISSGVPRENAMEFMTVASKAAIAGVTDTQTAVDGISTAMNAFKDQSLSAKDAADQMFEAVNIGKTEFPELASQIGQAAPFVDAAKVSFKDFMAAMATMTSKGINTRIAVTDIKMAMASMLKPSADLSKAFKSMGVDGWDQLIKKRGSMVGAFKDIVSASHGSKEELIKMVGTLEGATTIMSLTGSNAKDAAVAMDGLKNSSGAAGKAFDEINKSDARKFEIMKTDIQNVAMTIGADLMPSVISLVGGIKSVADKFAQLSPDVQRNVLMFGAFAAAAGPVLVGAGKVVTAVGIIKTAMTGAAVATEGAGLAAGEAAGGMGLLALAANPVTLGIGAVAAAAIGVTLAVRHAHTEDEKWRKTGVDLAGVIVKREAAVNELAAAHNRAVTATNNLKKADEEGGKGSPQYIAASEARKAAIDREAAAKQKLNDLENHAKKITGGVDDGKGNVNKSGKADAGENAAVRNAMVETENKIADAKERQVKAAAAYARETGPNTTVNTAIGAINGMVTLQGTIDATKKSQIELGKEMKTASSADLPELSRAFNENAKIISDNQKQLNDLAKKSDAAGQHLRSLQSDAKKAAAGVADMSPKEIDRLVKSLDLSGESAKGVAIDLSKMAATPINMKIAKAMLTEMGKTKMAAEFGTTSVNDVLQMIGTGAISPDIENSFSASLARMRDNAHVTITFNAAGQITTPARPGQSMGLLTGGQPIIPPHHKNSGGLIPGRGPDRDSVLAALTPGEYVIPRRVVDKLGVSYFDSIKNGYNSGGLVSHHGPHSGHGGHHTSGHGGKKAAARSQQDYIDAAIAEADMSAAGIQAKLDAQNKILNDKKKAEASSLKAYLDAKKVYEDRNTHYKKMKDGTKAEKKAKNAYKSGALSDAKNDMDTKHGYYTGVTSDRKTAAGNVVSLRAELQNAKIKAASAAFDKTASSLKTALADANTRDDDGDGDFTNDKADKDIEAELRKNAAAKAAALKSLLAGSHGLTDDQVQGIESDIQTSLSDSVDNTVTTNADDKAEIEAQLAQSQKQDSIDADNAKMNSNALSVFSGSNDLGFHGGNNAFQAAQGAPNIIINSLSGNDPAIQRALAQTTNTGNSNGSNADILYSGKKASGL